MNWDCFAVSILFYIFAKKIMDIPFKEGDIIVFDEKYMVIFAGLKNNQAIIFHALWVVDYNMFYGPYIKITTGTGIGYYTHERPVRYATMSEIQTFFGLIEKNGYKWNPKENKIEQIVYV